MADKGGLQLLPETRKRIEVQVPGENRYITIGIVALALVFGLYIALKLYAGTLDDQLAALDKQIADQELSRDKKAEQELLAVSQQAMVMKQLLGSHIFWTNAFSRLSRLYQADMRMKSFNAISTPSSLKFDATASSYSAVAHQIASFLADDGIKDVTLGNIRSNEAGTVEFSVELVMDMQKLLLKQ